MAEHLYDEVQEIELGSTGYIRSFNRSNPTTNAQHENSKVKKTTAKRCFFLLIAIIIGSGVSEIIVFSIVKYGGMLSYGGSACLWTEWTQWTGCDTLFNFGTEQRVQINTGYAYYCQQKEKIETRSCKDTASSCFWTDWTSWTPCKSSLMIAEQTKAQIGKQTRAQIFTGYAKNCEQKERFETKSCYDRTSDIRFDPTTLHSRCYLSDDHTVLSNRYTARTPYNPNAKSQFQKYYGAMVNTCVEKSTSFYYEIHFKYVITTNLVGTWLVLELGIGERNSIDNYHYLGTNEVNGWSFHLHNCLRYNKVCIGAQRYDTYQFNKPFSKNSAGTNVNGTFGILIDRERNKFSLFYNETVLFTFNEVVSNVPLCPIFGVYLPEVGEVDLQIVSALTF